MGGTKIRDRREVAVATLLTSLLTPPHLPQICLFSPCTLTPPAIPLRCGTQAWEMKRGWEKEEVKERERKEKACRFHFPVRLLESLDPFQLCALVEGNAIILYPFCISQDPCPGAHTTRS